MNPLHHQGAAPTIKRARTPAVEIPVLLRQRHVPIRWGRPFRRQLALLLLDESGAITGGYKDGKPLSAEQAQARLIGPFWQVVSQVEAITDPWSGELPPALEEDEDDG